MPLTHVKRLGVIQNKGLRPILGCTKDTSTEAMRYVLAMDDRHKLAQVKAYFKMRRKREWMTQAVCTI